MRPLLHPFLVNGRSGDPALYVETLFERGALLFDLGDISDLSPRKVQRLEHVFVSHAHIDHFVGFDRLLRVLVGRDKTIRLYGPAGFIECVWHKLAAYRWNLIHRFVADLVFVVSEVGVDGATGRAQMRLKNGFAVEPLGGGESADGALVVAQAFRVSAAVLEHNTPCLAFALEETAHVNVWRNRLAELGLPVGPWLHGLKRALLEERPDDYPIEVAPPRPQAENPHAIFPLGALRDTAAVTPGQKIGYVTDVADTAANREAIVRLVAEADLLFIEAPFAAADAALAADRAHLTTMAAGSIAREAGVSRVEPFHFSPRYEGEEARLINEVMSAFCAPGGQRS
jgi:ribonuclease Z